MRLVSKKNSLFIIYFIQCCRTVVGQAVLSEWRTERDALRDQIKCCFNPQFGSVFRSFHNYSYFTQRLGLYASMYTSSVTNLLYLPVNHICSPRRVLLPHEPHQDGFVFFLKFSSPLIARLSSVVRCFPLLFLPVDVLRVCVCVVFS